MNARRVHHRLGLDLRHLICEFRDSTLVHVCHVLTREARGEEYVYVAYYFCCVHAGSMESVRGHSNIESADSGQIQCCRGLK